MTIEDGPRWTWRRDARRREGGNAQSFFPKAAEALRSESLCSALRCWLTLCFFLVSAPLAAQGTDAPPWPRPPLIVSTLSEVEPPRDVKARDYRSPYCRLWDDGCEACRLETKDNLVCKKLTPENTVGTYPRTCVQKPIACHEIFEEELAKRCSHAIGISPWHRLLELGPSLDPHRGRPFFEFRLPSDSVYGSHLLSDWQFVAMRDRQRTGWGHSLTSYDLVNDAARPLNGHEWGAINVRPRPPSWGASQRPTFVCLRPYSSEKRINQIWSDGSSIMVDRQLPPLTSTLDHFRVLNDVRRAAPTRAVRYGQEAPPPWPRPPLIASKSSELEPSRDVKARDYRSPYCRLWDDGCEACRLETKDNLICKKLTPENTSGTYPRTCVQKPVACHEVFEEELAKRCRHFLGIVPWHVRFIAKPGDPTIEGWAADRRPFFEFLLPTDEALGSHFFSDWQLQITPDQKIRGWELTVAQDYLLDETAIQLKGHDWAALGVKAPSWGASQRPTFVCMGSANDALIDRIWRDGVGRLVVRNALTYQTLLQYRERILADLLKNQSRELK